MLLSLGPLLATRFELREFRLPNFDGVAAVLAGAQLWQVPRLAEVAHDRSLAIDQDVIWVYVSVHDVG